MADSLIQNLPLQSAPAAGDLLVSADVSASNAVKKLSLQSVMEFVLSGNAVFDGASGAFKLLAKQDCNGYKLENMAAGSAAGDAVRWGQVSPAFQALTGVTPTVPVVSDKGAFFRVAVSTITNPGYGFYLFYWCIDTSPSATISLVSDNPVASSGATVYFDGSIANVVNIIKDSGLMSKYLHVAVRYRNLGSISAISPTGHHHIGLPGFGDIVTETEPERVADAALSMAQNRLYLKADLPAVRALGETYQAELLFDDQADTRLTGNEEGLVRMSSTDPIFTYDIPLSSAGFAYVHGRILTVSLKGIRAACKTAHTTLSLDGSLISNGLIDYLAARLAEKLVTSSDEALKAKP